jgi:negative regulator of flagellin synthesis FlgM
VAEPESDVRLTGAARGMAALEQAVHAMPVVDEARVAEVKQRLQDGRYEIDPQRVADRLLRLEGDLRQGAPFGKNPLR